MAEESSSRRIEEATSALQQDDCDHNEDIIGGTVTYCGWFRGLCSTWRSHSSQGSGYDACQEEEEECLVKAVKKNVKAALVAILEGGPKWKTILIRRLRRRSCSCSSSSSSSGGGAKKNKIRRMQFQYDPKSYALNFDDGTQKELRDDGVYLDFSARYASPLGLGDSLTTTNI